MNAANASFQGGPCAQSHESHPLSGQECDRQQGDRDDLATAAGRPVRPEPLAATGTGTAERGAGIRPAVGTAFVWCGSERTVRTAFVWCGSGRTVGTAFVRHGSERTV